MSSYDVIDVLRALPDKAPARWVRLMVAVATLTEDAHGWRAVRLPVLAWRAKLHPQTVKLARRQLAGGGWLEYEAPPGRGKVQRYRLTIPRPNRSHSETGLTVTPVNLETGVTRQLNRSRNGAKPESHVTPAGLSSPTYKVLRADPPADVLAKLRADLGWIDENSR